MFKDLKRHLSNKSAKIAFAVILGLNVDSFVKKGSFSFSGFVLSLLGGFVIFLIFSWGYDNPESKGYKRKK